MNPRAPLALGLLVAAGYCGSLWVAYDAGHDHGMQECQLEQAKKDRIEQADRNLKLQQAQQAQDQLASQVQQLERELADRKPEKEIVYQTITKEVTKYAQTPAGVGCAADPDFVRIWNAAKDGRDPTTTGTGERGNSPAVPDAKR